MQIYLLRHGETAYNVEKRYQGTRDIPLSPQGRAALHKAQLEPAVVYVSPLCRARETASILFPFAQQKVIPAFREMCFGIFEGRTYREMERDPEYLAWVGEDCRGACPGGESRDAFSARTCQAFCEVLQQAFLSPQEPLVILAHGGTQMAILEAFGRPQRDYYSWCAPNASGFLLTVDAAQWNQENILFCERCLVWGKDGF